MKPNSNEQSLDTQLFPQVCKKKPKPTIFQIAPGRTSNWGCPPKKLSPRIFCPHRLVALVALVAPLVFYVNLQRFRCNQSFRLGFWKALQENRVKTQRNRRQGVQPGATGCNHIKIQSFPERKHDSDCEQTGLLGGGVSGEEWADSQTPRTP